MFSITRRAKAGAGQLTAALCTGALSLLAFGSAAAAENPYGAGYFPNVSLTNQDGKQIRFYDEIKGKSVAINVMYTSCKDECPLETAKLAQLQRMLGEKMGRDIFFYSISIDPRNDTPDKLKTYAKNFSIGPGWQFLTGDPADIKVLVKKLGLSRNSDKSNKDGHTASLMVGNEPTGAWMRNSAIDNPIFLRASIGSFLGWREDPEKRISYTAAQPLNLEGGLYMFQTRCSVCHTIGDGDKVGPDLAGLARRRERAWVARYLVNPDKMRAEGDPIALELAGKYKTIQMPNQRLEGDDLKTMLTFLESKTANVEPKTAQKAAAAKNDKPHVHQH